MTTEGEGGGAHGKSEQNEMAQRDDDTNAARQMDPVHEEAYAARSRMRLAAVGFAQAYLDWLMLASLGW